MYTDMVLWQTMADRPAACLLAGPTISTNPPQPFQQTSTKTTNRYGIKEEELRPYFALPNVLDGLFALSRRILGIEIVAADGEVEVRACARARPCWRMRFVASRHACGGFWGCWGLD